MCAGVAAATLFLTFYFYHKNDVIVVWLFSEHGLLGIRSKFCLSNIYYQIKFKVDVLL